MCLPENLQPFFYFDGARPDFVIFIGNIYLSLFLINSKIWALRRGLSPLSTHMEMSVLPGWRTGASLHWGRCRTDRRTASSSADRRQREECAVTLGEGPERAGGEPGRREHPVQCGHQRGTCPAGRRQKEGGVLWAGILKLGGKKEKRQGEARRLLPHLSVGPSPSRGFRGRGKGKRGRGRGKGGEMEGKGGRGDGGGPPATLQGTLLPRSCSGAHPIPDHGPGGYCQRVLSLQVETGG